MRSRHPRAPTPRISDIGANTVSGGAVSLRAAHQPPAGQRFHQLPEDRAGAAVTPSGSAASTWPITLVAPTNGYGNPCNCVSTLNNGVPAQVQILSGPNVSKNDLATSAGFVDDTWRLNRRVTLSLGHAPGSLPAEPSRAGGTGRADVHGDRPRPHVQQLGPTRGHERRSHGRRQDAC